MLRKMIIALATVTAIGAVAMNGADAASRWHGGGGGGGHWHGGGGWHGGGWHGGGWHHGWHGGWGWGPAVGFGLGFGAGYYGYPYYAGYGPYYYSGCYRRVRVATPYGWRWRRVWVCG